MTPIHALLARIRWDREFGRGEFAIGYWDRVARRIVRVPLARVEFDPANRARLTAIEADGSVHEVPLHRIREVWRDGELIWRRRPPANPAE
jgi:uncharacterized protein (UPF0248 family)